MSQLSLPQVQYIDSEISYLVRVLWDLKFLLQNAWMFRCQSVRLNHLDSVLKTWLREMVFIAPVHKDNRYVELTIKNLIIFSHLKSKWKFVESERLQLRPMVNSSSCGDKRLICIISIDGRKLWWITVWCEVES